MLNKAGWRVIGGVSLGLLTICFMSFQQNLRFGLAIAESFAESPIYLPVLYLNYPSPFPNLGHLVVSEIMYNPLDNGVEWVEIYNPTKQSYNLRDFKLGDEETLGGSEGMFRFPKGYVFQPGEILVIAKNGELFSSIYGFSPDFEIIDSDPLINNMEKYTAWTGGSFTLSNSGDEILLLNRRDTIEDAVSWGSSEFAFSPAVTNVGKGYSIERSPVYYDTDSKTDWLENIAPDPGSVEFYFPIATLVPSPSNVVSTVPLTPEISETSFFTMTPTNISPTHTPTRFDGTLLISEVLYDPLGDEPDNEWFELYNPGDQPYALSGFKIGDEETDGGGEGMLQFPAESVIDKNGVIIIANNSGAFYSAYGFFPDFEIQDGASVVPDMIQYSMWATGKVVLNNSGDELIIFGPDGVVVDAVSWGDSSWAFSPSVTNVNSGSSIIRSPPDRDTDSKVDWQENSNPNPGQVSIVEPTATSTPTNTPVPTDTPNAIETPKPSMTATEISPSTDCTGILITEFLYDPIGDEPAHEWIELLNVTEAAISLGMYKVGDDQSVSDGKNEGMYEFPSESKIDTGQMVVVAYSGTAFFNLYGRYPDYEIIDSTNLVLDLLRYENWSTGVLQLANVGDDVLILSPGDIVCDGVSYGDSNWAFFPDSSVPIAPEGFSIERKNPYEDTDTASDWDFQQVPNPGY